MKTKITLLLACFTTAVIVLSSCGKEEDNNNNPTPKTKTQLLSQGTWKFSSATVGGADASAFVQTCQKDNILTFAAAGTGILDEGATKCNAADPQTSPFTWTWASNETVLNVSTTLFTGGSSTFTLVSLTETNLVLSQVISVGGSPQTAIVTFVH